MVGAISITHKFWTICLTFTIFSNDFLFLSMTIAVFWFKFHWSLFPLGPTHNKSALVQVMGCCWTGTKPLAGLDQCWNYFWRHMLSPGSMRLCILRPAQNSINHWLSKVTQYKNTSFTIAVGFSGWLPFLCHFLGFPGVQTIYVFPCLQPLLHAAFGSYMLVNIHGRKLLKEYIEIMWTGILVDELTGDYPTFRIIHLWRVKKWLYELQMWMQRNKIKTATQKQTTQ